MSINESDEVAISWDEVIDDDGEIITIIHAYEEFEDEDGYIDSYCVDDREHVFCTCRRRRRINNDC